MSLVGNTKNHLNHQNNYKKNDYAARWSRDNYDSTSDDLYYDA